MSDDEIKLDHLHEHKLFLQLLWKQVKKKKLESSHAILASKVKMSKCEAELGHVHQGSLRNATSIIWPASIREVDNKKGPFS